MEHSYARNKLNHEVAPASKAHKATMYFDTPCAVRNDPEGEGLRLIAQS